MSEVDPRSLAGILVRILQQPPSRLTSDERGFVAMSEIVKVASTRMATEIEVTHVRAAFEDGLLRRLEIRGAHIRLRNARKTIVAPDILYHACTERDLERYELEGAIFRHGRPVQLVSAESQAWRMAHRQNQKGRVLVVDTSRGRRKRLRMNRGKRTGTYNCRRVPLSDVLNLQPNYGEQISAGGIPVVRGPHGRPLFALIRVRRRSGETWEIAKGKLEVGEPPEWAAIRETQEEMGVNTPFEVGADLGRFRYGFMAPGGLPRLKTVHVYLLRMKGEMGAFHPALKEGVEEVAWFHVDDACRAVSHASLVPMMRKAKKWVNTRFQW